MLRLVIMLTILTFILLLLGFDNNEIPVIVTAYSPRVQETDSTPFLGSCGNVYEGSIAVSRDMFPIDSQTFSKPSCNRIVVLIFNDGTRQRFIVRDTMNKRYRRRVDIFILNTSDALHFGIQKATLIWTD